MHDVMSDAGKLISTAFSPLILFSSIIVTPLNRVDIFYPEKSYDNLVVMGWGRDLVLAEQYRSVFVAMYQHHSFVVRLLFLSGYYLFIPSKFKKHHRTFQSTSLLFLYKVP